MAGLEIKVLFPALPGTRYRTVASGCNVTEKQKQLEDELLEAPQQTDEETEAQEKWLPQVPPRRWGQDTDLRPQQADPATSPVCPTPVQGPAFSFPQSQLLTPSWDGKGPLSSGRKLTQPGVCSGEPLDQGQPPWSYVKHIQPDHLLP